jgi:hypothetical protein
LLKPKFFRDDTALVVDDEDDDDTIVFHKPKELAPMRAVVDDEG